MEEFRRYRDLYIKETIGRIQQEQGDENIGYVDIAISNYDRSEGQMKYVCCKCKHVYYASNKVRLCSNCTYDPDHYDGG